MIATAENVGWRLVMLAAICALAAEPLASANGEAGPFVNVSRDAQAKMVKIFGVGGVRGLEAYQSGLLISAEGHVLTAWSYVLDDVSTVVLDDGRRFPAELVGADPLAEIAVLKIDAGPEPLPHFDLTESVDADVGTRVLAFSNLFGIATGNEPVSVLQGHVAAVAPLAARRGAFRSNYRGDVYIVDAAINNPGASGGALTDQRGRLVGMLGKELRSELTGTWLNYALPVAAFEPTVEAIIAGRFTPAELAAADRPEQSLTLSMLGIVLVPDVVARTPPYVDRVLPNSPAARAGIRPDDLVVMLDSQVASSCRQANALVERRDHDAAIQVAVLRGDALLEFTLSNTAADGPTQQE